MGIKGKMNQWRKGQAKKKAEESDKDFHERAGELIRRCGIIAHELRCDFQPYIKLIGGGSGGTKPALQVIDTTKQLKEKEERERKQKIAQDTDEFKKGQIDKKGALEEAKAIAKEAEELKAQQTKEIQN